MWLPSLIIGFLMLNSGLFRFLNEALDEMKSFSEITALDSSVPFGLGLCLMLNV
jgi:hypothetical protein